MFTKIKVFGIASLISALFSFYLMISSIITVQFGEAARKSEQFNTKSIYTSYAMNSAMIAFGVVAFAVGLLNGIIALALSDSFTDSKVLFYLFRIFIILPHFKFF